jgi:GrpB-like predicted nucleotidyltransferase (UPF0157 family)/aminoglycoside phosphotransferase (APT) family kinase protein
VTFKINWERIHTIVHLPDDLIRRMLGTYYSENEIKNFHIIEGGCANINVLVRLNQSDIPIILRVYCRDKESVYKEKEISELLNSKLPVPKFHHIAEIQGHTFAITEYLPGKPLRDFLLSDDKRNISQIMFKVGRALNVISSVTLPSPGFFNKSLEIEEQITRDKLIIFCLESLENSRAHSIIPAAQIQQIKTLFNVYKNFLPGTSETNLVHADFDPANILVTENNGEIEISGILDWEFAFSGSTLWDVANMLRYANHMPREYQGAFLKGLTSSGYKLPKSWQITIKLLNIVSLLDSLNRSALDHRPNQITDIKELINHILLDLQKVEVVPYDPNWPKLFKQEASKIKSALGARYVAIHHVGSTAVPGLAAKPKIDIVAELNDLAFDHQGLTNIDYEYRGGFNLPLRKSFTYRSGQLNINLHVFEKNDPEIALNLLFRDYLRTHSEDRDRYASLKYQLLEDDASHKKDGSMYRGYTLGKHDLINDILHKAGFSRLRFVICTHYTEWNALRNFRNKYFFAPNNITDPYTWTFEHSDHRHFILYKGTKIVGYAHIQLWANHRAALRIIVIDEEHRGKHYGAKFMALIEKWLKLQKYKSVHVESSPKALWFYQHLNYAPMAFNDPDGYESDPEDIAMGKIL